MVPRFNRGLVPEFGSSWTDQMGAYLRDGIHYLGVEGMKQWVREHLEAIARSWGDKSKADHILWPISEVFGKAFAGECAEHLNTTGWPILDD